MKKSYFILSVCVIVGFCGFLSCKKIEKGFISDFMFYSPGLLIGTQGNVVNSKPLELDGSSGPITVKLLAVRNLQTGQPAPELTKEYTIQQYSGQITAQDSTIELVNKKIIQKPSKAMEVNEIGGRVSLSQATTFIAEGTYVIDVQATNDRGTRTLNNALKIQIQPKVHFSYDPGTFYTTSDVGSETGFSADRPVLPISVTRDPTGPNKIIFTFLDKNGVAFNPAAGEVITRGDRGNFAQMNPYFPLVKTATTMEWGFIELPNGFPIKEGSNGTGNYYRIRGEATVEHRNYNPVFFSLKVFSPGTYTVSIKIPTVTRKP